MANTYSVEHDDVANELPGLFPDGFSAETRPSAGDVSGWIAAADVIAALYVRRAAGKVPAATDQGAPLAALYIKAFAKAEVVRVVYAGRDPREVAGAAAAYEGLCTTLLEQIAMLGTQAVGDGTPVSRVKADITSTPRALLLGDAQLDGGSCRVRKY